MLELINKKQRGLELTPDEISRLITGFGTGEVPDYQMSAFLMAAYFQGLSDGETLAMTQALIASGERWELPAAFLPALDKHSTGGVGDKTTLLLVPMLAALGLKTPKMAGRGLGLTGGTIDKLESIPGMRTEMTRDEAMAQLERVGCFIISQSGELVPAEKKLYALRDVTGTTAQEGLIISSILSKKIACGASHIIIDVKHGSGAFLQTEAQAMDFAERIVRIGSHFGPRFAAAVSAMEQPLGKAVGNALEVAEVLRILEEHDAAAEVCRLCAGLGGTLLLLCGKAQSQHEGEIMLAETVAGGRALAKFKEMITAQGGDLDAFKREMDGIGAKVQRIAVNSPLTGHIRNIDAQAIARFCHRQGAGRSRKGEAINPWAGVVFQHKAGEVVAEGGLLAEAYAKSDADLGAVQDEILGAFEIGDRRELAPLVSAVII
jgi:pyrimidine-nucleoside phosphorylase